MAEIYDFSDGRVKVANLENKGTLRVVMAVTNDLVGDRRVLRHVEELRREGCEVRLVGKNDVAPKASRGWRFYAEYNWRLWRLLRVAEADVVWANDSDTLLGCWMAARHVGAALVMDAHELFPEVPEIRHKPMVKAVWRTIERMLMPRCEARLTVCGSIAEYYQRKLGVKMEVVRNMQPSGQCAKKSDADYARGETVRTLLYQGAVNVGRGVDWAIDALEWLTDCRLVVAGGGGQLEQMRAYAAQKPWAERVDFRGMLKPEELDKLTPKADVGLVMLEDMGLSYHYALPNRIGDFIAAGVPMVVSDLPEMAAVVRRHGVGEVMERPGARALAEAVEKVVAREWHEGDFATARQDYNWEREREGLSRVLREVTK